MGGRPAGITTNALSRPTRVPDRLWIELPEVVDSLRLYREALAERISLIPGPVFSASKRYGNCIRVSCAVPWTPGIEAAIRRVGELAGEQLT